MKKLEPISGADLAKRLLGAPDVDHLIATLAGKDEVGLETPILEFKASWKPKPGDNATEDECRWNVVKAIIAMANASGGCIVLGLAEDPKDKNKLIPGDADPDGILKNPARQGVNLADHTKSQLLKGNGKFHIEDGTLVEIIGEKPTMERMKKLVELHVCKSKERSTVVIVIIVEPIDDEKFIYITKSHDKPILCYRSSRYAKTEYIDDMTGLPTYMRERSIRKPEFAQILARVQPTDAELRRRKNRNRLFIAGIVLLVVFCGFLVWHNYKLKQKENEAREEAENAKEREVVLSEKAKTAQDKYDRTIEGKIENTGRKIKIWWNNAEWRNKKDGKVEE